MKATFFFLRWNLLIVVFLIVICLQVYTPFCADTATDGTCLKYESREVDSTYQVN
jgi:hypothetical protein